MAQLIKLNEYISRYAMDIFRYTQQFQRMKARSWEAFLKRQERMEQQKSIQESLSTQLQKEETIFDKVRQLFKKERSAPGQSPAARYSSPLDDPMTRNRLLQLYQDQLLSFQIKWASSTIAKKSSVDQKYFIDRRLRQLLQQLPDTYFILYDPIILIKAPIQLEVLAVTPGKLYCMAFLEGKHKDDMFVGSSENFWIHRTKAGDQKVLSPELSANRMEKVVKHIFRIREINLTIQRVIISETGSIFYRNAPAGLLLLDQHNYENWLKDQQANGTFIQKEQLHAAKSLLDACKTESFKRER